jgi:hypothetical protein
MDVISPSKDQMYAYTHALMYLTDFGLRSVPLPRSGREIDREAGALLSACLDEPDYDVAGEVLLTWPLLRRRWSASAALGFGILASVEDQIGFLPGSGISPDLADSLTGKERSRYAIATAYHTAYVMGLLCATILNAHHRPPIRAASKKQYKGAFVELLALLESDGSIPIWQSYVESLPPVDRDSAAELIFNVCLQRAAAKRNLASIYSTLSVGQRFGLLGLPASRQAAELLQRSSTFAALNSANARRGSV